MITVARTHRRFPLWFGVLVGLCMVLVSCGGDREPDPTSAAATPGQAVSAESSNGQTEAPQATPEPTHTPATGTVTLWHSWAQGEGDALAEILDSFHAQYPGVTVGTLFVAPDDLLQSYAEAVQAGGGPDLLLAPNWWLDDLVTLGVVQPLDGAESLEAYWPAALDNLRWQGKLYGLPVSFDLVALYTNVGLVPPERVPRTTDEMLSLATNQPAQGAGLYNNLFHLVWGIPAYGGRMLDDTGRATLDQSDGAGRYLAWLRELAGTPGSYVDGDYGMLLDRFKKGEFAFFVDGPWAVDELRGALGDNLAVTTLPAGPAGPAQPWLYAQGVFLNPASSPKQQALARMLAGYVTGPEAGGALAQTAGLLPANRNAVLGSDPAIAAFVQQAATAQAMPHGAEMEQVWRYGGDMLVRAAAGREDPAAIVTETTALINEATGR